MGKQQLKFDPKVDVMLTQQNAKDECDINLIVEKAKRGADLSSQMRTPRFGNLIGLPDFREALNLVVSAQESFMALDAVIRKRFDNDPALLLDFLNDEANRDEAIKLGLVAAPAAPKPDDPLVSEIKGLRKDISDSKSKKAKAAGDGE